MYYFGITSNIMSLGGIALAIGVVVDASMVMVENAYRRLSEGTPEEKAHPVRTVIQAAQQVGRPIFFSLVIVIVSFTAGVPAGGPGGPAVPAARPYQDPGRGDGLLRCWPSPWCRRS